MNMIPGGSTWIMNLMKLNVNEDVRAMMTISLNKRETKLCFSFFEIDNMNIESKAVKIRIIVVQNLVFCSKNLNMFEEISSQTEMVVSRVGGRVVYKGSQGPQGLPGNLLSRIR